MRNNIGKIIQVLHGKNPSDVVFVAKLITGWKKINNQSDALCRDWHIDQSPVIAVDMTRGFINDPKLKGTMTYDFVHPNKSGQLFMMKHWYEAIVKTMRQPLSR